MSLNSARRKSQSSDNWFKRRGDEILGAAQFLRFGASIQDDLRAPLKMHTHFQIHTATSIAELHPLPSKDDTSKRLDAIVGVDDISACEKAIESPYAL
ncbi:hypothetical protein J6590_011177 [Homalodisca vitripennis]|nr:hypothetical protein J6590_011177 [Homalodisca vitripennis]